MLTNSRTSSFRRLRHLRPLRRKIVGVSACETTAITAHPHVSTLIVRAGYRRIAGGKREIQEAGAFLIVIGAISAFAPLIAPVVCIAAILGFFAHLKRRATRRANEFSYDYPSLLMATASGVKAGMTPLTALRRAALLLPEQCVAKEELQRLFASIEKGESLSKAVGEFGKSVEIPELPLFRSAFMLAAECGGRFSPTLERLALVVRDRTSLVQSARVSTASMRMTANFLLSVAPAITLITAARTPDYFTTLLSHPVAFSCAALGGTLILGGYITLLKMSAFQP
jgi:tight adherence protein B